MGKKEKEQKEKEEKEKLEKEKKKQAKKDKKAKANTTKDEENLDTKAEEELTILFKASNISGLPWCSSTRAKRSFVMVFSSSNLDFNTSSSVKGPASSSIQSDNSEHFSRIFSLSSSVDDFSKSSSYSFSLTFSTKLSRSFNAVSRSCLI